MIKYELTARGVEVDDRMRNYLEDKIGGLEKFVPRGARETVGCAIVLEDDVSGREDNRCVCEAVLSVPGDTLVSREGTVNFYAAIDIVEAKLKAQLVKYKEKHTTQPRHERMAAKLLGRTSGKANLEEFV